MGSSDCSNFSLKSNLSFVYTVHPGTHLFVHESMTSKVLFTGQERFHHAVTHAHCATTDMTYHKVTRTTFKATEVPRKRHTSTQTHTRSPHSVDGQIIDLCTAKEINVRAFKKRSQIILTP